MSAPRQLSQIGPWSPRRRAVVVLAGLLLGGCATTQSGAPKEREAAASATPSSEEAPARAHGEGQALPPGHPAPRPQADEGSLFAGVVVETMDSGGYTYMRVQLAGGEERWAAAEAAKVSKGDRVTLRTSMRLTNFRSKTLNRTFESIFFVYIEEVAGPGSSGLDETI